MHCREMSPKPIKLLVAYCLAHGRRQFVQITPNFPEQCRHVLEALGAVYQQDRLARERLALARRTVAFPPAKQQAGDERFAAMVRGAAE